MKYKQITAVLVSACLLLAGCAGFEKKQNPSYTDTLFDTVIKVQILGSADEDVLKGLEKLCKDYDKNFSMTNEEGELYKINHAQGAPVEVSDDMVTLIQKGIYYSEFSRGAFDITIGSVSSLWDFKEAKVVPSSDAIQEALTHINYKNIHIQNNTVQLTDPYTQIDLGAIANEMHVNVKITSGPAIEKPGEMAAILNNLQEKDVLFVDEIHRLNRQVEEVLYPAMEDYAIDIMIGKGATARSIRLDLPKFTLVGATTRAGMLTAPLRDRFGVVNRMEYYTIEELKTIILRSAKVLSVGIDERGADALARRSRGTPRLANRLLKRVRDFAQVKYDGYITEEVSNYALDLLDVDREGLDQTDRDLLLTVIEKFGGGPVGLDTLSASIGEDAGTIEDVYEPYLLKNGFIQRTPRGRIVTEKAYGHLGISYENNEK